MRWELRNPLRFFRRDDPTLAQLATDGWTLIDAEGRVESSDGIFWIPPRKEREAIHKTPGIGGMVKLIFQLDDPGDATDPCIEWMWVSIVFRSGRFYHGHLLNEPYLKDAPIALGAGLWFRAEHVIDIADAQGENRATARADTLQCASHGTSLACYACMHVYEAPESVGYYLADDPGTQRPDAWCEACEKGVSAAGGWDAPGAPDPQLRRVCGGCYDALLARHVLRQRT